MIVRTKLKVIMDQENAPPVVETAPPGKNRDTKDAQGVQSST